MEAHELVDVVFPVRGAELPADHGYLLFSALCEAIPRLSHEPGWALVPVDGQPEGEQGLRLGPGSMVQLRLPARELGEALALTGRDLSVGVERVHLGMARIRPLAPASRLRSAAVTIPGCTGDAFRAALRRELATLPLGQAKSCCARACGRSSATRSSCLACGPMLRCASRPMASAPAVTWVPGCSFPRSILLLLRAPLDLPLARLLPRSRTMRGAVVARVTSLAPPREDRGDHGLGEPLAFATA
jgi:CRISPR-associated protein Cas6